MCLKRASATDGRMLSDAPCVSPDARAIFARKTPAILIGNVVQNTKNFSDQVRQILFFLSDKFSLIAVEKISREIPYRGKDVY